MAGSKILGDKAYVWVEIRNYISEHNATYAIPSKRTSKIPGSVILP